MVAVLLPDLISDDYIDPVTILCNQITYFRLPETVHGQNLTSDHEHLWGYKFSYDEFSNSKLTYHIPSDSSLFDRFISIFHLLLIRFVNCVLTMACIITNKI